MKTRINKKTIIIIFIIMLSATSFYYAYKKTRIGRPIAAKLVYTNIQVPRTMLKGIKM